MKHLIFIITVLISLPVLSWTNHFIVSYYSLLSMQEIQTAKPVVVESLDNFVKKEAAGLAKLLEEQEEYARKNFPNYSPRSNDLKFDPTSKNLKKSFLESLRVNPNIKLALFLQKISSEKLKQRMPYQKVSVFEKDEWLEKYIFQELKEGQSVSPFEVTATAADEPDYGLDIGLFSNNESEHGKVYGFGEQPFGDPRKFYGSQAPFHMGFFHEAGVIYAMAGFIKRTNPEYRIYLYNTLAKYAFQTGHDYWGYRFSGWGLHYIGDLTQPYHSTLFPGKSTLGLIWTNISGKKARDEAVIRLSDRHTAIEHYEYYLLDKIIKSGEKDNKFLNAFQVLSNDSKYPEFTFSYVRDVLSKESNGRADDLDERIEKSEAVMLFKDRDFDFSKFKEDETTAKVQEILIELFQSVGSHTRNFLRDTIKERK
ncbi:MAG: hypothetical protein SFU98_14915 [Leptospiraceae bacterium]|nr:hypothetical protein [Leptospiraceae bacterium]